MNREIEARLKISGRDNTGNLFSSIAGKMAQINRQASALNRQQTVLARTSAATFAAIARYAAPAVLAYGAKAALTDFAALERQMTRIGITADASAKDIEEALGALKGMSKDMAFSDFQPAIAALDTLVASGMNLKEAMAFLPSVLATAQATGAATEDIANTGMKAASALKISADQMQRAFDIMVVGGKAGQFELKDMAQYIPGLANSFASLGYSGEEGLKKLVAILQTVREDTGDASSAATQAQNIFGKIYSEETANKFKDFGINLRKELEAARKAGEDTVSAFVRISQEAIKGDMSKLPLLFSDQEFRLGMQSLITSEESLQRFMQIMNSTDVSGTVFRDLGKVLGDTQAKIDKMSVSWEKLKSSFGGAIAKPASAAMDAVSADIDYGEALRQTLEKRGMGYWERESWIARNLPFGALSSSDEASVAAYEGGWRSSPHSDKGPMSASPELPSRRQESPSSIPIPTPRPSPYPDLPPQLRGLPPDLVRPPTVIAPMVPTVPDAVKNFFRVPSQDEVKEALKIDTSAYKQASDEAGQKVAEGGREAGKHIEESSAFLKVAGVDVGAAITSAADKLLQAAIKLGSLNVTAAAAATGTLPKPNGDPGRSMPPSANRPAGSGPI
ncbi:TP901 family phage tail tape measure protein [Neorhizobium galegae]|uniref:phage tail tape measure protein n=1 Tax=Neorhizobium galegae TaxID=399 RepID=UPI001AEA08A4|nr:phage tail tape measure protein [Neorhizobium galegae]MBP2560851.1 TP901 family phage tail tape measure protein [Neorhizobium galegae]